jgi:hypothetical protein
MCGTENETKLRVDVIDSSHRSWPMALRSIETDGRRGTLLIDADGWLSARQCLIVAFAADENVAGHLLFRLDTASTGPRPNRPAIAAHLDDVAVRPGFDDATVRKLLVEAAKKHAKSLRVRKLVDFE